MNPRMWGDQIDQKTATLRWRTGRSQGCTLYLQAGATPAESDILLGMMETAQLATYVAHLHNQEARRKQESAKDLRP